MITLVRCRWARNQWQAERKCAAVLFNTFDIDAPAVQRDDLIYNIESNANSTNMLVVDIIGAVEALE